MLSPSKAYSDTYFQLSLIKRCWHSSLSTCMPYTGSGGPPHTSLCHGGGLHVTLRGWPTITRTLSLHTPNCCNVVFQGVVRLPTDQQSTLRSFILWSSIKTNRFEEDFIPPPHFLHPLQLLISREQKEVTQQSTLPSSSSPITPSLKH